MCIKELGVDRYNLVGWSDGGITALCLASLDEYRGDSLIRRGEIFFTNY